MNLKLETLNWTLTTRSLKLFYSTTLFENQTTPVCISADNRSVRSYAAGVLLILFPFIVVGAVDHHSRLYWSPSQSSPLRKEFAQLMSIDRSSGKIN
ncbi:hypothetical protein E2C01_034636 [Portunus trituberculatus]|uniref:Transmembrane protein n=1 Tax=Portunus trituberculatus TaxID=210409 RepID=A0A5B7F638_PORTR|nr:hypothetical protein [Portunus trituberculatus]